MEYTVLFLQVMTTMMYVPYVWRSIEMGKDYVSFLVSMVG